MKGWTAPRRSSWLSPVCRAVRTSSIMVTMISTHPARIRETVPSKSKTAMRALGADVPGWMVSTMDLSIVARHSIQRRDAEISAERSNRDADRLANILREQDGEGRFGGEHAAGVVAAERDHGERVPGAEFLIDVFGESLAARQARGALGHGGAGGIEAAQGQDVDFAQQIGDGPLRQLLS